MQEVKPPRWDFATWEQMSVVLLHRCRGRCEWCGGTLTPSTVERHHRMRRAVGGDRLSNILMLCPEHHRYAHGHPYEARERGVIVHTASDPLEVPLVDTNGIRWLLDDEGSRTPGTP